MAGIGNVQSGTVPQVDNVASSEIDDYLGPDEAAASDDSTDDTPVSADGSDSGDTTGAGEDDGTQATGDADSGDRIAELAQKYKLDANNPDHKNLLDLLLLQEKRIQDKDSFIYELKNLDLTTDLDRQLSGQPQNGDQQKQPPVQQPQNGNPLPPQTGGQQGTFLPRQPDIGDQLGWRNAQDAYTAFMDAGSKGDVRAVAEINQAIFARQLEAWAPALFGQVEARLQHMLKEDLGPVFETVKQNSERRMHQQAEQAAIEGLKKNQTIAKVWDDLFKPLSNEPITDSRGARMTDNSINRIVRDNPHILDIHVPHPDPRISAQATWEKQYKAVIQIHMRNRQSANPQNAGKLIKAGADMAKRQAGQDRARQSLNAGGRQRAAGSTTGDEVIDGIMTGGIHASGEPFSSMFRKR